MESIRSLRYFITVAEEESYTRAAKLLGVAQPTLSKQLKELESEFGHALFARTTRSVSLTPRGERLYERAKNIVVLYDQARREAAAEEGLTGDIRITAAETPALRGLIHAVGKLQEEAPRVRVHFVSADEEAARHDLQIGLSDFVVFVGNADSTHFALMPLAQNARWGLLSRRDGPFASKSVIDPKDLLGHPVMISEQSCRRNDLSGWFGSVWNDVRIVGSYTLLFNASLMAREGVAHVLAIDGIIADSDASALKWIPLSPAVHSSVSAAWNPARPLSPAAKKLLEYWRETENQLRIVSSF